MATDDKDLPENKKIQDYANFLETDTERQYLFASLQSLQKLEGAYPPHKLAAAKLRLINQLLYQLPLTDEAEAEWLSIKQALARVSDRPEQGFLHQGGGRGNTH